MLSFLGVGFNCFRCGVEGAQVCGQVFSQKAILPLNIDELVKSYVMPRCGTVTENNLCKSFTDDLFIV